MPGGGLLACSGADSEALLANETAKGQPDQLNDLYDMKTRPMLLTVTMGGMAGPGARLRGHPQRGSARDARRGRLSEAVPRGAAQRHLASHEACTKDSWIYFIGLPDLRYHHKRWFQRDGHPTKAGQRAIAGLVAAYLKKSFA
jgi:hypothetical protein